MVGEGQVRGGGGEEVMKRKEGRVREKMEGGVRGGEEVMRGRDGRVRKKMGWGSEGKVKGWGGSDEKEGRESGGKDRRGSEQQVKGVGRKQ